MPRKLFYIKKIEVYYWQGGHSNNISQKQQNKCKLWLFGRIKCLCWFFSNIITERNIDTIARTGKKIWNTIRAKLVCLNYRNIGTLAWLNPHCQFDCVPGRGPGWGIKCWSCSIVFGLRLLYCIWSEVVVKRNVCWCSWASKLVFYFFKFRIVPGITTDVQPVYMCTCKVTLWRYE